MILERRNITPLLRACLHCGCLYITKQLFCESCFFGLQKWKSQDAFQLGNIKINSLFSWWPEKSDALSQLILFLKGGCAPELLYPFVEIFIRHYGLEAVCSNSEIVFIPAPPRKKMGKDHAHSLALAFQKTLGGELCFSLERVTQVSQRALNRTERSRAQLRVREKYTNNKTDGENVMYIFIDDVVTTGSTAMAAYVSLGKPINFTVWALARRMLACGSRADLL